MVSTAPFLVQAVSSALKQTAPTFEIIIVNDGSTDETPTIAEHLARDDSITVLHKANGGLASARNTGLDVAKGDYVCFLV